MKFKIAVISIFLVTLASCKKEEKADVATAAPKEEVKQNFSVEVDVISEKPDNLAIYYTEDNTINFTGERAVWRGVKGQNQEEHLVFDFSEELVPTTIRMDFGINTGDKQGDVTLKKFKVVYYGKSFEANGSDFFKYFIPNEAVKTEIDAANGSIKFLKDPKATHFYYPQQAIVDEIKKLTAE